MSVQAEYVDYVVIGVGINVDGEAFPEELEDGPAFLCGSRRGGSSAGH